VTEEAFEQVVRAMIAAPQFPGWRVSLLKSDRGTQYGKYGVLFEIESVEARDGIITEAGLTEESRRFDAEVTSLVRAWERLRLLVVEPHTWSDYQVIISSD
jgi:hypothetical protein